jgi:hypothetical protein
MRTNRFYAAVALLLGCAMAFGCPKPPASTDTLSESTSRAPNKLADREAIAKLLPNGVTLETQIPFVVYGLDWPTERIKTKTVEKTLQELGAKVSQQGQLVDSKDRRIVFQTCYVPGRGKTDTREPKVPPDEPGTVSIVYRIEVYN